MTSLRRIVSWLTPRRRACGWTIALAGAALLLVYLAFRGRWTFGDAGTFAFEPRYADLVALLASGEAKQAGLDIYAPNPLDPLNRPHVYGPGWLVTGPLGLRVRDARWLGPLLLVVFIVSAAVVLAPRTCRQFAVSLAFVCSPPILLGIDRVNNDLIVFLLLAAAAWFLARQWSVVGGVSLGLAATLKLYPFAALPLLLMRGSRWRTVFVLTAAISAGCLLVLLVWRNDYREALRHAPKPQTIVAYGLDVIRATWRALPGFRAPLGAGYALGGMLVVGTLGPRIRRLWTGVPLDGFSGLAFLAGAMSWVFCFLATSNFPYRIVLLLLPARLWLEQTSDPEDRETAKTQLLLWASVCWLSLAKGLWARAARGNPTLTSPAWKGLEVVCGVEQGLMAVLTLALAISIVGAFARRLHPLRRLSVNG